MFPTSYSTASSSALAEHLPHVYDIAGADGRVDCFFVDRGWSDIYLVRGRSAASDGSQFYYLKVYAAEWKTASNIRYEVDLVTHLYDRGLGVARPVPCRDGNLTHSLDLPDGRRCLTLSYAASGAPLSTQPLEVQGRLMGHLTAQVHDATADFRSSHHRAPIDLKHLLDLSPLDVFAQGRESDRSHLQRTADRVSTILEALPLAALPRGVCHGDLGPRNVFLESGPEGRTTIIDFDDCAPGCLAFDLGHAFMFFYLFHAPDADHLWRTYLDAYHAIRPLEPKEIAAAPAFALALLLKVHGHDNPIGAARDRWDASWYVSGAPWRWILNAVQVLSAHVGEPPHRSRGAPSCNSR